MNPSMFKFTQVKTPKRSGFDKGFKNLLTMPVGTLVPLMVDEVVPNTRIKLSALLSASLPPLASDSFMSVSLRLESFFTPYRQLYGGFEKWLTGEKVYDSSNNPKFVMLPRLYLSGTGVKTYCKPASSKVGEPYGLLDYLGLKFTSAELANIPVGNSYYYNIFPIMAYHYIWDNWYRNTQIQRSAFQRPDSSVTQIDVGNLPYMVSSGSSNGIFNIQSGQYDFADGVSCFALRQRNFGADYFTTSFTSPQSGNAQGVTIDTSGTSDVMTISALRSANSLQQWLERNQLAGFRLVDWVRDHYGAHLTDGNANRPLFLGSGSVDVYSKGVELNSNNSSTSISTNNPFGSVGSKYGNASANGSVNLIDDFVAQEPGCIFVMASLVPKVTYSSGVLRQMMRFNRAGSQTDLANPILQNVGNEPIYQSEIYSTASLNEGRGNVFGYTQQYASWMCRDNELHGILRDGESLQSFALQRNVVGPNAVIGSSFLEIPRNYLDQVTAGSTNISNYGVWVDSYLDYKVSMPLQQFSIPSLQNPAYEHGKSHIVQRGGRRID